MIFDRIINDLLQNWKAKEDRKPLVIRGARQVGKTTVVNNFSKSYKNYISLNLEKEKDKNYFDSIKDVKTIVEALFLSNNIDIIIHLANRGGGRDTLDMKNITEYNLKVFFNITKHEKNITKIISFGSGAEYCKHKPIIDAKEEEYWNSQPEDEYGLYKSITSKYIEKVYRKE